MDKINDPRDFQKLTEEEKESLKRWILENYEKSESLSTSDSYGMKHRFEESSGGFYVTNGAFKGAVIAAGFTSERNKKAINWRFFLKTKQKAPIPPENSFVEWLFHQRDRNDPIGDLARDAVRDPNFPTIRGSIFAVEDYFESMNLSCSVEAAIEMAFKEWKLHITVNQ